MSLISIKKKFFGKMKDITVDVVNEVDKGVKGGKVQEVTKNLGDGVTERSHQLADKNKNTPAATPPSNPN